MVINNNNVMKSDVPIISFNFARGGGGGGEGVGGGLLWCINSGASLGTSNYGSLGSDDLFFSFSRHCRVLLGLGPSTSVSRNVKTLSTSFRFRGGCSRKSSVFQRS
ncbi:hypothetical protein VTO42DRAFT_654 [Malbranchea cinnamomea]